MWWRGVILEKLIVSQLIKTCPEFYRTGFYYRIHKICPYVPKLSQINPVHSRLSNYWRQSLILYSHLRLDLPSDIFPLGFLTKSLYAPLLPSAKDHTCPANFLIRGTKRTPPLHRNMHWGLEIDAFRFESDLSFVQKCWFNKISFFFLPWRNSPSGPRPLYCRGFTITLRHTRVGRTPLDEWPALRRDLYLTTNNIHKRQTSMPPVGFEPTIPKSERPQIHDLDRAATGIGCLTKLVLQIRERKWVFNKYLRNFSTARLRNVTLGVYERNCETINIGSQNRVQFIGQKFEYKYTRREPLAINSKPSTI